MKLIGDREIGDKTNIVIRKMADRLTNLVAIFEDSDLDFGGNSADGDDVLGDASEFLVKHFATESGKSKGQLYTSSEV